MSDPSTPSEPQEAAQRLLDAVKVLRAHAGMARVHKWGSFDFPLWTADAVLDALASLPEEHPGSHIAAMEREAADEWTARVDRLQAAVEWLLTEMPVGWEQLAVGEGRSDVVETVRTLWLRPLSAEVPVLPEATDG